MAVGDMTEYRNGAWVKIGTPVNPPPPGVTTLYGASYGGASDEAGPNAASFERINAQFGGLEVARYFPDGDALQNWTSFPQFLRDAGCAVIFSWQIPPATVISGASDAILQAHFQSIPTDREIWSNYYHEVDDDISAGTFTLEDYWAAHQHIRALKNTFAPANYHLLLSLNGDTFIPSRSPSHPYTYYWDNSFEAIGANLSQKGTTAANLDTPALLANGALEARDTLQVPLVIPELGVRNTTVQNDAARALWLSQFKALVDTKASAVCYYESFRGTLGPWNITEEPLGTVYSLQTKKVWAQAVSGTDGGPIPYSAPPPPPPPGAGMYMGNSQVQFDPFQTIVSNPTGAKGVGINTGFSMRRSYDDMPTLFAGSTAGGDPARGVMSHWSHTPGATYPTTFLTSTTLQNQWRDFCRSWPANHGGLIAVGHEPENNGYDLADYREMQRLAYQIFVANIPDHNKVKYGIITTNEPFRAGANVVKQYYPQLASGAVDFSAFDYVGVDYYRYWRPTVAPLDPDLGTRGGAHPITYWADPVISFAQGHPIVVAEHSSHPDPNNLNKRPSEFQGDLDYWESHGCIAFDVYHSKLQPGHGPWWWHVLHCYPITSANAGTGVAPWNNNNPDDQTHPDTPMLNKVRQVLEAKPRYDQATFTGWGF